MKPTTGSPRTSTNTAAKASRHSWYLLYVRVRLVEKWVSLCLGVSVNQRDTETQRRVCLEVEPQRALELTRRNHVLRADDAEIADRYKRSERIQRKIRPKAI